MCWDLGAHFSNPVASKGRRGSQNTEAEGHGLPTDPLIVPGNRFDVEALALVPGAECRIIGGCEGHGLVPLFVQLFEDMLD